LIARSLFLYFYNEKGDFVRLPTVEILFKGQKAKINQRDYDPSKHILWEDHIKMGQEEVEEQADAFVEIEVKRSDFEDMTVRELMAFLNDRDFGKIPSSWRKDDLVKKCVEIYEAENSYV